MVIDWIAVFVLSFAAWLGYKFGHYSAKYQAEIDSIRRDE